MAGIIEAVFPNITAGAVFASAFFLTASPFVLWICVVKAKMKWPVPALLPPLLLLSTAAGIIRSGERRNPQPPPTPANAVQPQTPEVARSERQTPGQTSPQQGSSTEASDKQADVSKWLATYRNEQAIIRLGNSLRDKGDFDGAIAKYREALRLRPADGSLHSDLGWAFEHKGDLDNATKEYEAALKINSQDNFSRAGLGRIKDKRAAGQQPSRVLANHAATAANQRPAMPASEPQTKVPLPSPTVSQGVTSTLMAKAPQRLDSGALLLASRQIRTATKFNRLPQPSVQRVRAAL